MFLAITSIPAVLALTLTLPVVDDGTGDEGALALPTDTDYPADDLSQLSDYDEDADVVDGERMLSPRVGEELHHLVEGGFSPLHSPLGRINHSALRRMTSHSDRSSSDGWDEEDMDKEMLETLRHEEVLEFHRGLTAVQCVLGPAFCVSVIFSKFWQL
jgi:sodium/potassium/calcium exchanger 6